jgi:HEAT repeat protein
MANAPSSGLGRSIEELFQNLHSPAAEPEGREAASSPDSGSPVDSPPRAETGDEPVPAPASPAVEDGPESGGDGDPGTREPESGTDQARVLAHLVTEYLDAAPDRRDALAPEILGRAARLRDLPELEPLVDAVIALSLAGADGADEEVLALSRELLDGAVVGGLVQRIGEEREEEGRESLGRVAALHAETLAPAMAELLSDAPDRRVRRSIMDILGGLGEPGRAAALGLLEDPHWHNIRNGVVLLGEIGGDDLVQALTVPLGHDDPRVRRETVTALSRIGTEDAGLLLVGMLEDGSPEVRAAAATGVGILRVDRAQRVLEEMLDREDSDDVVVPVLRALGQLGDPGPVPAIEKKATGSLFKRPPREVRIAAYRALAAIGTPHARTVLRNGAGDKDPEIQHAVGMILRQIVQDREESRKSGDGEEEAEAGSVTPDDPGRTPTSGPE